MKMDQNQAAYGFVSVIYARDVRELFSMVKEVRRVGCKVYLQTRYLNLTLEGNKYPRSSLVVFYIVNYCIKRVTPTWTYSMKL